MKKVQGRVSAQAVASFLVFDRRFPRSLRYCLLSAKQILLHIWPEADRPGPGHGPYARLDALTTWLDKQEATSNPNVIHALLTRVVDDSALICSDIAREILGPPQPEKVAPAASQTQSQSQTQSLSPEAVPLEGRRPPKAEKPEQTGKAEVQ